jgi:hypothetical protein
VYKLSNCVPQVTQMARSSELIMFVVLGGRFQCSAESVVASLFIFDRRRYISPLLAPLTIAYVGLEV